MNNTKWLNIFIWILGFIGFVIPVNTILENKETIRNKKYSISKNVVSKIRFGKSPKCGKVDCWMLENYDDSKWNIVPLPNYDFRTNPDYFKGIADKRVYYRIKINPLKNLDCKENHVLGIRIHDNGSSIVKYVGDTRTILPNPTSGTGREVVFKEGIECNQLKKYGSLLIVKSYIDRKSTSIYYYYDFQLMPENVWYRSYRMDECGCSGYGIYAIYSIFIFLVLIIYLLTPSFCNYEFFYIFYSFIYVFCINFGQYIERYSYYLEIFMLIPLAISMLCYLKKLLIYKGNFYFFSVYKLVLIFANIFSFISFVFNYKTWSVWQYFYTVKGSYVLTMFIISIYLFCKLIKRRKGDFFFFLGHTVLGVYCLYDHISYFESFLLLTGCLFFLNKKLLRMLDKQIIIKENENKLDEMITFKSIGKIFSSLIHDVKRPLTQAKSFLESDELSFNEEFIILEVIKKDLREVDNLINMLLKVVGENSSNREYIEVNNFIDKILSNYKIVHKSLSEQRNLYIPTSRDLDYAFGLLNTFLSEKNKKRLVHLRILEKKFKFYLVINLPFNLFNKNFEYISEHEQIYDKKLVRSIHDKNLKWAFIKKVLSQHMDSLINSIEDNKQINRSEIFIRLYKRNVE